MAAPRVFISSTCYDLKYIRENLKYFIRNLGYEPVMSEEGSVYYNPLINVQDACVAEIPSCQILVLIIGGRFGSEFKDESRSITNQEFLEAIKHKIPAFALVEQGVHDQYFVYNSNKDNTDLNSEKIRYPAVDSTKIFQFISDVQSQSINNALVPFSDFEGIQSYLRQQWASMFNQYLMSKNEESRVTDLLKEITATNEKIEFLSRQVVKSVGDTITQLKVQAYDLIIEERVSQDLLAWNIKPVPEIFLKNEDLDSLCNDDFMNPDLKESGKEYGENYQDSTLTFGGPPYTCGSKKLKSMRTQFAETRSKLLKLLKDADVALDAFLSASN